MFTVAESLTLFTGHLLTMRNWLGDEVTESLTRTHTCKPAVVIKRKQEAPKTSHSVGIIWHFIKAV